MIHYTHPVQLIHRNLDVVGVGPKIMKNDKLNQYTSCDSVRHCYHIKTVHIMVWVNTQF